MLPLPAMHFGAAGIKLTDVRQKQNYSALILCPTRGIIILGKIYWFSTRRGIISLRRICYYVSKLFGFIVTEEGEHAACRPRCSKIFEIAGVCLMIVNYPTPDASSTFIEKY